MSEIFGLYVRLTPSLLQQLSNLSERTHRSMELLAREAVLDYLANQQQPEQIGLSDRDGMY